MAKNLKYSNKDFSLQDLSGVDDFEGDIVSIGLSQENPNTVCLPANSTANISYSNLDNCVIPVGCTLGEGNTNKNILQQNDLLMWELDGDLKPIKCLDEELCITLGLSIDPNDIPAERQTKPVTVVKKELLAAGG